MMDRLRSACLIALAAATGSAAPGDTWTDSLGRAFEGELVAVRGDDVIFVKPNGRRFLTPLAELSRQSQARLVGRLAAGTPASAGSVRPARLPAPANLGAAWPREVRLDGGSSAKVISQDRKNDRYVYESPNYRFTANARLTDDALRNLSVMFECTRSYAKALPLGMSGNPQGGGKFEILLFETAAGYERAGGTPGSGGCFVPGTGAVMVPMASLGLIRGSTGFRLDHRRKNHVLVHELAHQLSPVSFMQAGARGWFSEGVAEYIAATPYTWGRFCPDIYGNVVKEFVTGRGRNGSGGRALGTRLNAPPLRDFMLMDYREFSGPKANFNYGLALLVTHYFFHMQGGGDARRITDYLRGLRLGRSGERALEPLLGDRSFARLEEDISDRWGRLGVEIRFPDSR
jgi:hypothetical protein